MLAKILSKHHGFKTTVLFSMDAEGGFIDPNTQTNIPHTDAVKTADLVIFGLRFRNLSEEQLQPLADYLNAGKPLFGFRTSTHAFKTKSKLGGIDWSNFGPSILGEGWVNHYGKHRVEGARGKIEKRNAKHPILNSVSDIFALSDVYGINRVKHGNSTILVHGVVTESLLADSADVPGKKPQPAVWLKKYKAPNGKPGQLVGSTFGSSCDLMNDGLRRLFINSAYFLTGLEVPKKAEITLVDPLIPSEFAFIRQKGYFKKLNLKPADFTWGKSPRIGKSTEEALIKPSRERVAKEQARFQKKDISGPHINSTITSVEEQREKAKRPAFPQPTPVTERTITSLPLSPAKGESIVFIGNALAERMLNYGHFESLVYANFPEANITLRNMGYPAHTPAYRPEAGQPDPWAFPGAEKFRPEIQKHFGKGHYPMPDEWLRTLEADTIVAFFGFNESFDGPEGIANFKSELSAFVDHSLTRAYNTKTAPKLVLATPIATENLEQYELPDSSERNRLLALYANVIREVAAEKQVGLLDLFTPSRQWAGETINGVHLSNSGYQKLAPLIFETLFGKAPATQPSPLLLKAVNDKNWFWRHDYRIANGVHVYGQRWAPYGNYNYPEEIEKVRQMTVLRDQNIWNIAQGKSSDLKVDDSNTRPLTPVKTNYKPSVKNGQLEYLEEKEAISKFTLPEGYAVSTFATEKEFPNLGNPMQMRFDNQGRLWVATMPSYPHYRPGDARPNDKILIYEDTDGDGRADKETVWADGLSIPIGMELAPEGVYVTEAPNLVLLKDTDGDGKADTKEYLIDGFDPHDSHHSISAFDVDHGGGIFMCEGRFLHSQVETPYGPQRMTDGGVWRWDHKSWKLERVFQVDVSNPWGVAHDPYGQNVLNDASGGQHYWMGGYGIKMPHGAEMAKVSQFNYEHRIRPTSGSEFLYSRHFPDEVQGDYLYANTIGFLGIKQFQTHEMGTEINGTFRQNLLESSDGNFRPADLELAPDGSLYFIDWHNALIGHMQHNARDPNRSGDYGRIYRITYPSRELVKAPVIAGASIEQLFENLKLPEINARKRSQRELRGRKAKEVLPVAHAFAKANAENELLVLEALWATWGQHQPSLDLLQTCLSAEDYRVRSAAVRVIRHSLHLLENPHEILLKTATDKHARVRIESLNAASWLGGDQGAHILLTVAAQSRGKWINNSLNSAIQLLKPNVESLLEKDALSKDSIVDLDLLLQGKLKGAAVAKNYMTKSQRIIAKTDTALANAYLLGTTLFHKEGSCGTCHQDDGNGLKGVYPPLTESEWVTGSKDRLIKLALHGLWGPIEVNGVKYSGQVPMTALGGTFNDKEMAAVLTYVRTSWGNEASLVTPKEVEKVRAATKDRKMFYKPEELLKEHPMEN